MTRPLMEKINSRDQVNAHQARDEMLLFGTDAGRDPQADDRFRKNRDQRGADAGHDESKVGDA